ncbi:MAG: MgtC/SapB family protein [Tissierellia bacterium]|nr:MgtC/SapB family protein [Tissierellia bacterium]
MWDNVDIILFRLFLALIFSGLIGYEREVSESNAGLKTHILVAIGSTIVALMQVEITQYVREIGLANPLGPMNVTSDASRLIAQVVSGIGFLGAGTIIVTKSNISGLTTAASIWAVASIGLALGMGFYPIAVFGFLFVILTLFIFKRFVNVNRSYSIIVKYMGGAPTLKEIKVTLDSLDFKYELLSYNSDIFVDYVIRENVFKIKNKSTDFQGIMAKLSNIENIISVERSDLHI